MQSNKKIITIIAVVIAIVAGAFLVAKFRHKEIVPAPPVAEEVESTKRAVIGKSVEGREIISYTYGKGEKHVVFVGGIHGGYEWNSVLLAHTFLDYLDKNPNFVPSSLTITVIPSANPDGLFKVLGKEGRFTADDIVLYRTNAVGLGRFNANEVDLNRNFDCKWKPESTWRSQKVNAGTSAFSEPEAQAIRNFVSKEKPDAFVFWHSQSNAVYASECEKGILPETLTVMNTYAKAAGYPAVSSFDAYPVTGDAEGWLASINIPAITVELKTHETIEWDKNLAGVKALLDYYAKKIGQ